MLNLIDKELTKVLNIHFRLCGIHYRNRTVQLYSLVFHSILYCFHDVR